MFFPQTESQGQGRQGELILGAIQGEIRKRGTEVTKWVRRTLGEDGDATRMV